MATPQQLINLINSAIVTNGSNQITAIVLNPILVDIVTQYDGFIGDLSNLLTADQTSLVNAINEVFSLNSGLNNVIQGTGISINFTDPSNPIISLGTLTTNSINNASTAPGVSLTDALDFLYSNSLGNIATLGEIGNVDILTQQTGQAIIWNQATLKWENKFYDFINLLQTPINYNLSKGKNLKVGINEIVFLPDYLDLILTTENSNLTVSTVYTLTANRDYSNISKIEFSVTDAPTGQKIKIDVLKDGTSIYSTIASIDIGEFRTELSSVQQVLITSNVEILSGQKLTINVTQVGSIDTGKTLKATIIYNNPLT
jgi:hypothetical protein